MVNIIHLCLQLVLFQLVTDIQVANFNSHVQACQPGK